jgi:hypothetical protein
MRRLCRQIAGKPVTIHGFRDWCAENGVSRDLTEAALAHAIGADRDPSPEANLQDSSIS